MIQDRSNRRGHACHGPDEMNETFFKYDVGLSFAGEHRQYVEAVKTALKSYSIYDGNAQVELWGKDLYSELHEIYRSQCQYCILFVSQAYAT